MKLFRVDDLKDTERAVIFSCGMISNRVLLEIDGLGYSLSRTDIPAGDWRHWHYKNHFETCYCIQGKGLLHVVGSGELFDIYPGVVYVMDKHDDHNFKALEDTVLVCVFTPPLKGAETHGFDGSYGRFVGNYLNLKKQFKKGG